MAADSASDREYPGPEPACSCHSEFASCSRTRRAVKVESAAYCCARLDADVRRRVSAYSQGPADLSEESSLREILEVRDLYSQEPKNLASFDVDKVKILHRTVRTRPIAPMFPPQARGYLRHHHDLIERDEMELEDNRNGGMGFSLAGLRVSSYRTRFISVCAAMYEKRV